jgi:L-methionine (R)-S-oxide reductase
MADLTKSGQYEQLITQLEALIDPECSWLANYANICAALQDSFRHWWCGFYFVNRNQQLELGPFQGPVACTLIPYNKGVCGTSWAKRESIIVPDVHQFEGHIACSSESNSEIVIPIIRNNRVIGVLDIDSINFNQFDEIDQHYLERIVELLPEIEELQESAAN